MIFERFDDSARSVVTYAQQEARLLGHDEVGDDHLLLGVASASPQLVGVPIDALRARVSAARGATTGATLTLGEIPFTDYARAALAHADHEAERDGRSVVVPADLLAALIRVGGRAADVLARIGVDSMAGERRAGEPTPAVFVDGAQDDRLAGPPPAAIERLARDGEPIPAGLGGSLIGAVGHPVTDARLLLAILAKDGPIAHLLRDHGVDPPAIRSVAPGLDGEDE